MKRLLLILAMAILTLATSAQNRLGHVTKPTDLAPNITINGGPYVRVNSIDWFETGAYGVVNFKDIASIGPYYQISIQGNQFYGIHTQVSVTPKEYYFQLGGVLKAGLYNHKYISLEPGMIIQHNNMHDNIRFTHVIAITGGPSIVSYSFGLTFGNFKEKYWRRAPKSYFKEKREQSSMYYILDQD